jgi:hypothetical protein
MTSTKKSRDREISNLSSHPVAGALKQILYGTMTAE